MALSYRLRQFWHNVSAVPLPPTLWNAAAAVLSPAELALFRRFSPSDQWHSVRVMASLRDLGETDADLLAAALLHDIGKTRLAVTVWERSLVVLMQWLAPHRLAQWGSGEAVGWKRPFALKVQHPAWGAEMAAQASSRPRTIALIRRHQDPLPRIETEEDQLLALLQWADDLH